MRLGENLKRYLDDVVSWEIVTTQYNAAYELARAATKAGEKPMLPEEF